VIEVIGVKVERHDTATGKIASMFTFCGIDGLVNSEAMD